MTKEERQKIRQEIMEVLEDLQHIAYSGVSSAEYDAIKNTRLFMKLIYEREENRNGGRQ
jgi:uncharacterized protein YgfB (UPF0149 family)